MKITCNEHIPEVAIIDSGIDLSNTSINSRVTGGISFEYNAENKNIVTGSNYQDENGHGTACVSIIKKVSPMTSYFVVKILDSNARTNSKALINALRYLVNSDIRLINISITTIDDEYKNEIEEVCNLLYARGKILVASLDNRNKISYPAIFTEVIGVRGSHFSNPAQYWYNNNYKIQCIADIHPVLCPKVNNRYELFGGNSKATALVTGLISKILISNPSISFEELNKVLENRAERNNWLESEINVNINEYEEISTKENDYDVAYIETLANIIIDNLKLSNETKPFLFKYKLYNPLIGLNSSNCFFLIKKIEEKFNLKFKYETITLGTFDSIYSLYEYSRKV
jgi:subtilisin family serine protease